MAYTTIDNPELYFQVKTYSGNGGSQSITFDGDENMQGNMLFFKSRSNTEPHMIIDSVRGVTNRLRVNLTSAEDTTDVLTSFDSDGLTFGSGSDGNSSGQTYVAWCWKAGGSASSNSDGSITSSVSANTTAGFSIVSWTANNTAGATVGHGLSSAPKMVIVKNRTSAYNWTIHHQKLTDASYVLIFTTAAQSASTAQFNDTAPSSTVITLGAEGNTNSTSGNSIIAYAFNEVQGYSKFGSYTSNFSSDGVFVYLGFKPSFVMVKSSSAAGTNWVIHDNKRHSVTPASGGTNFNVINRQLMPNLTNADDTNDGIDFLSNGFKWRWNGGDVNGTAGRTYVYMAFAEAPFVNSNGVPCNAR